MAWQEGLAGLEHSPQQYSLRIVNYGMNSGFEEGMHVVAKYVIAFYYGKFQAILVTSMPEF